MTEQEAIEIINNVNWEDYDSCYCLMKPARDMAIKVLEEVQQYRALGTVEELKEAKEKQVAKKPYVEESAGFKLYHCPGCAMPIFAGTEYCSDCGQKLLWKWGE